MTPGLRRAAHLWAALVVLAASPRPVPSAELAERLGCHRRYLEAGLQALKRAGVLEGKRGKAGGYRLARAPARIRLGEVLAALSPEADTPARDGLVGLACEEILREEARLRTQSERTLAEALEEAAARGLVRRPPQGWDFCI